MNTKLLRQKILDLAIRGKLTDQRKSDGTARELLEKISASLRIVRSVKSAKSEDSAPIIPLDKSEAPFEIPDNWEWVKLGSVCLLNPADKLTDDMVVSFVPMANIGAGFENRFISEVRSWNSVKSGFTRFANGDIAVAKITPCFENRKSVIFENLKNGFGAGTTELHILRTFEPVFNKYIFWYVKSEYFIQNGIGHFSGAVGQQRVGKDVFFNACLPLPPLAEQQRIVKKIEEAFAEIDAVEKNKELLKTHIKQTRQKILDLAIHGKLVPQDKNDEPASVLLEKILQEKVQSDNKKSPKKKKTDDVATSDNRPYEKITVEDEPFEIPSSWEWVKLKSICEDFIVPQRDKPTEFTGTIPWCRIEDIEGKYLNGSKSHQLVTKELADKMNMHLCPKGTVISACSASIGNQAITTVDCYTNQTFIGIVCNKALLFNEYLYYFLASQSKTLKDMGKGTTIGYISRKKYEDYAFPLPPLTEQKRIVDKIEEIFRSLDEISLHLV